MRETKIVMMFLVFLTAGLFAGADIEIISDSGLHIYLDGSLRGTTGESNFYILDVPSGRHVLIARKPGYREIRRILHLKNNLTHNVYLNLERPEPESWEAEFSSTDTLKRETGRVAIYSTPKKCSFTLGGITYNKTSSVLYIDNLPSAQYNQFFFSPGYDSLGACFFVEPGRTRQVELDFINGRVLFLTSDDSEIEDWRAYYRNGRRPKSQASGSAERYYHDNSQPVPPRYRKYLDLFED